jgi:hypothetical protein
MTNRKPATRTDIPRNELTEQQLDLVSAGTTAAPRDVSTGMATGKRMHKPICLS